MAQGIKEHLPDVLGSSVAPLEGAAVSSALDFEYRLRFFTWAADVLGSSVTPLEGPAASSSIDLEYRLRCAVLLYVGSNSEERYFLNLSQTSALRCASVIQSFTSSTKSFTLYFSDSRTCSTCGKEHII